MFLRTCFLILPLFIAINLSASFTDPTVNMDLLRKIWADHAKEPTNYYDFTLNNRHFRGQLSFEKRWNEFKELKILKGKKVLELGCNVGLFSIFASKYLPIERIQSTERDLPLVQKCLQLQEAFKVKFPICQLNLDRDNYEKILGTDFDVVLCMRLYHWVQEKDRLMRYLSQFNYVVYEGHEEREEAIARFEQYGFPYHQRVGRFTLFSKSLLI